MSKAHLKDIMLNLEAKKLAYSEQEYKQYLVGAARDRSEPSDHDSNSQEFESSEIAASFECPIHTYEEALAELKRIDFGPKTEVTEGATVRFNGRWFVIAVATENFVSAGTNYMGISTKAPIYSAIEGKSAGDEAVFNGKTFKIEQVA